MKKNTMPQLHPHDFIKPLHHFDLKVKGHPPTERYPFDGVRVTTDYQLTSTSSKDNLKIHSIKKNYTAELIAFIANVEADWARRRAAPKTLGALPPFTR